MNEECLQHLANVITVLCVRNDPTLETIHKCKTPISNSSDFSDVFVIDVEGNKIPWNEVSRISQDEMKSFMKNVSNHIYDFLCKMDDKEFINKFMEFGIKQTMNWELPSNPAVKKNNINDL